MINILTINILAKMTLPLYILIAILATFLVIALIAFRFNYVTQMRVSLYMDIECNVFNKNGLVKYFKTKGKKFTNPTLVVVELKNLAFLYSSYYEKIQMMVQIADSLLKGMEPHETLARVEFNRFVLLLDDKNSDEIKELCRSIEEKLDQLYFENYGVYNFSPYFGVYQNPDLSRCGDLMEETIAIMDYATVRDGNIYYFSDDVAMMVEKMRTMNRLKVPALENKEFVAYIQPKVSFKTGKCIGGEILVRWVNSQHEIIYSPGEFIPLFEKNGFITKIDYEMFEQTCVLAKTLVDRGYPDVLISVNVSKLNFDSPKFIEKITEITNRCGASPKNIEIEITETDTADSNQYISNCIMKLRSLGFHIAMDDFGKEYSSLGQISSNQFDTIKMDMIFFRNGLQTDKEKDVVRNIINLLNKLKCEIVTEGIENRETLKILATMSKNLTIQGYVISKPIPVNEFEPFLQTTYDFDFPDVSVIEEAEEVEEITSGDNHIIINNTNPSNSEIQTLKIQIEEMRRLVEEQRNTKHQAELDSLRREMENMKRKPEDDSEVDRLKKEIDDLKLKKMQEDHDKELDSMRRQMEEIRNQSMIKETRETHIIEKEREKDSKDEEIEKLKREIENIKNSNERDKHNDEIDRLRREIDDLRRTPQQGYPNPYPYGMPYLYTQQQNIDVDGLIARLAQSNQAQLDAAMQDAMNRQAEANKDIKARLEEEKKARAELESMLLAMNKEKDEEEEEADDDEIRKAQEEADANLNLNLDGLDGDDDEDDDDDEKNQDQDIKKPDLTLEQIGAIIKNYQDKYQDDWNEHAQEELKGGYQEIIDGLKYYQKFPVIKRSFLDRVKKISKEQKQIFNIVKNELMKYENVTNKLTNSYDAFYKGRNQIAKISFTRSKVKVYLAVDPAEAKFAKYPHKDLSNKKAHAKTPYYAILRSSLSVRRIQNVITKMMKDLENNPKSTYKPIDYAIKYKFMKNEHNNSSDEK